MRSIYKCPCCGHEELVYDEYVKFMHPTCPECFVLLDYDRDDKEVQGYKQEF